MTDCIHGLRVMHERTPQNIRGYRDGDLLGFGLHFGSSYSVCRERNVMLMLALNPQGVNVMLLLMKMIWASQMFAAGSKWGLASGLSGLV